MSGHTSGYVIGKGEMAAVRRVGEGQRRRDFVAGVLAWAAVACRGSERTEPLIGDETQLGEGNFQAIYGSPHHRAAFRDFLVNVFHLYPASELDELIAELVQPGATDADVYLQAGKRLPEISPLLGSVRYALPTLSKQKREMAEQTCQLLGDKTTLNGYLEVGSHGRYLDHLQERVNIRGPVYTTAPVPATHGLTDIIDRGQLTLLGQPIAWNDYAGYADSEIEAGSVDLITIYIGLHHATEEARRPYLQSLRRLLSEHGCVIIRDHDVRDTTMRSMVGLAHDVFNLGTRESWATNAAERRNFYSLEYLIALFEQEGFRATPARLRQAGDPTLNTLVRFDKA